MLESFVNHSVRWQRIAGSPVIALVMSLCCALVPWSVVNAATDVVLVLDNSGSMRENDPEFLLKQAVSQFVTDLDGDSHVGIVIFDSKAAYPVALGPLSDDSRAAITAALEGIDYRGQLTNSPAAIERAIYELKSGAREDAGKVIIFMTDGIVDTGDPEIDKDKTRWMREELAADAADNGVKIFGIAFTENADFFLIQSLAKKTAGEYFRALTPDDLADVFARVHEKLAAPSPIAVETPPPSPSPTAQAARSCLDTLVDEERMLMEEAAPDAGITAEELCREMMDVQPGTAVVVRPGEHPAPQVAQSCLDTLVAEERVFMEEAAPDAGITAEELCREMMDVQPGTAVVVRPGERPVEHISQDDKRGILIVLALAVLALIVIVALVVFLLRRRGKGDVVVGGVAAAAVPVPEAFLKDVNGITGEPAIKIGIKPVVVGRVLGNDPAHLDYFVVDKGTVGRRHAIVQYRNYGFWLSDQGSVNGTFLNGQRIEEERQLKHGDRIKFHKYEFEFSMPEMDDGGHTVFADPGETMVGEATMIGSTVALAQPEFEAGTADEFDERVDIAPASAAADHGDLFDDDLDTAVSARNRDVLDAGDETAEGELEPVDADPFDDNDDTISLSADVLSAEPAPEPEMPDLDDEAAPPTALPDPEPGFVPTAMTTESESEFDAEASAFFDEDDLGQTNAPPGLGDFDEAETVLPPAAVELPETGEGEEDFSESETLAPEPPYNDDRLSATGDISVDDFMETETFQIPLGGPHGLDADDETQLHDDVPPNRDSGLAIGDVFDITGEGTIPPVKPGPDDDDDDDDPPDESEAPTEFRR